MAILPVLPNNGKHMFLIYKTVRTTPKKKEEEIKYPLLFANPVHRVIVFHVSARRGRVATVC